MLIAILIAILTGALIGWIAGLIMKSKHGFWVNCLIGIIGSALGNAIGNIMGIGSGILGIVCSIAGTCLLIVICRAIWGKKF